MKRETAVRVTSLLKRSTTFVRLEFILTYLKLDALYVVDDLYVRKKKIPPLILKQFLTRLTRFLFCSRRLQLYSLGYFVPRGWCKGPFTQAIFVAATQCNSMQCSCNQLRFHCDFSAICQCKRQYTSIPSTKAMCLLKSENTTQSQRVS